MTTQPQTATAPEPDQTVEKKIQQLRELFADAPEMGKAALENALPELKSQAAEPQASRWKAPGGSASVWARSPS